MFPFSVSFLCVIITSYLNVKKHFLFFEIQYWFKTIYKSLLCLLGKNIRLLKKLPLNFEKRSHSCLNINKLSLLALSVFHWHFGVLNFSWNNTTSDSSKKLIFSSQLPIHFSVFYSTLSCSTLSYIVRLSSLKRMAGITRITNLLKLPASSFWAPLFCWLCLHFTISASQCSLSDLPVGDVCIYILLYYYHDCDGSFRGVNIHQYVSNMCSSLNANYTSLNTHEYPL